MLGRQVTAAFRRPLHARLRITAAPQTPFNLCIRTFSYAPRLLESAGRPRKAVGEPSRPVKRAVKKAAKDPATVKADAAAKKVAAKEKQRLAKEKALKKKAADKERAQKAKTKKAADAKKAKQLALKPEQVAKKRLALLNAENKELKKVALDPPFPKTHVSAYTVFTREKGKETFAAASSNGEPGVAGIRARIAQVGKLNAALWKDISPSNREHYNHAANTEKQASIAEYKRWVESLNPEEIKLANAARKTLRRRLKQTAPKSLNKWRHIVDERAPKKALTPYLAFNVNRRASGDFNGITITEGAKLIGQEWKALSADEKKKYETIAEQDHQRYLSEVSSYSSSPSPTA